MLISCEKKKMKTFYIASFTSDWLYNCYFSWRRDCGHASQPVSDCVCCFFWLKHFGRLNLSLSILCCLWRYVMSSQSGNKPITITTAVTAALMTVVVPSVLSTKTGNWVFLFVFFMSWFSPSHNRGKIMFCHFAVWLRLLESSVSCENDVLSLQ